RRRIAWLKKGTEMADPTPSWAFAAAITVALTLPAAAQTAGDIALGKRLYQARAECGHCHGWSGDGAGDPLSPGQAANLRETKLDHDQLVETIRCGVVGGTAMAHFDKLPRAQGGDCLCLTAPAVCAHKPPP